jgi:hypothetical protein
MVPLSRALHTPILAFKSESGGVSVRFAVLRGLPTNGEGTGEPEV